MRLAATTALLWGLGIVLAILLDPLDGTRRPPLDSFEDRDFRAAYLEALRGEWFGECTAGAIVIAIRAESTAGALWHDDRAMVFRLRVEDIRLEGRLRFAAENVTGSAIGPCELTVDDTLDSISAIWQAQAVSGRCGMKRVDTLGPRNSAVIGDLCRVLSREFP